MVNSTQVTADINDPEKLRKYQGIFLNTIAAIARDFRAKIIKNACDCLIISIFLKLQILVKSQLLEMSLNVA